MLDMLGERVVFGISTKVLSHLSNQASILTKAYLVSMPPSQRASFAWSLRKYSCFYSCVGNFPAMSEKTTKALRQSMKMRSSPKSAMLLLLNNCNA